ncbi:MAG: type II toxin-antitoxin system RelE/ParE family toxin [Clostridiaceae bacterium]
MNNHYNIDLTKKAEKFIKKQDKEMQKRLIKAIIELPIGDIKKLKGMSELYRLRVGSYRVIFEKKDTELTIIVVDIGNRGQIYK